MEFAIVVQKYADGSVETLRSTQHPPSSDLEEHAKKLDAYLHRKVRAIERQLISDGLLAARIPEKGAKPGNASLWYALGSQLTKLCQRCRIEGKRERRWLWEAIYNLHATNRIKRAQRGRTRNHFEYCFRLAQFPRVIAERLNWSEWVYFFDSLTVREEPRADRWLARKAKTTSDIDRRLFRRYTENLNRAIKKMDTSVLEEPELFHIYETVWKATRKELQTVKPAA